MNNEYPRRITRTSTAARTLYAAGVQFIRRREVTELRRDSTTERLYSVREGS
jgi:hypothetical protein